MLEEAELAKAFYCHDAVSIARINAIESALKAAFPDVRWSFFEPDDSSPDFLHAIRRAFKAS